MHNAGHRLLIWDLPTRVFHWLLVAAFTAAWVTFDDNRYLDVHVYAGYLFYGLLVFRLVWGMIGSRHARFRSFAYEWPSVWAYLRGLLSGQAARHVGHNPAGAWAIFLMLALGLLVSLSGVLVLVGVVGFLFLRGRCCRLAARHVGHNPAGAWAIFLMLALGLLVSLSGVLVLGGEEGHGPLRGLLPYAVGTAAKEAHEVLAWTLLVLTTVHVAGVVVES